MKEGEMGKIIVPPSLAYTSSNIYNLRPYTALYYEARAISSDNEIEEKSKINKYLYMNNVSPDSIFTGGILYFNDKTGSGLHPVLNTSIEISDSLYYINLDTPERSCQNCTKIYNSSYYTSGQIKAIHALLIGGSGTFVMPYSEMFGGTTNGSIPPYSTLVYKVELHSN
ncbi:MAG: hypothetical protein U9Q83_11160, partial [Bacteroidota bacterium]|nr:hypothetical protein [Bacteroidota bacterium]